MKQLTKEDLSLLKDGDEITLSIGNNNYNGFYIKNEKEDTHLVEFKDGNVGWGRDNYVPKKHIPKGRNMYYELVNSKGELLYETFIPTKYTRQYLEDNPIVVQVNNVGEHSQLCHLGLDLCNVLITLSEDELFNSPYNGDEPFYRYYLYKKKWWGQVEPR